MAASTSDSTYVIRRDDFDRFLSELRSLGYDVLGPSVADGAVTLGSIACAEDLPQGVGAKSSAGRYRLEERTDRALFGFGISSASVKRWLLPPRRDLWRSTLTEAGITFHATSDLPAKTAIVGLRACDLQAIEVLDGVFLGGAHVDPYYEAVRGRLFFVVVDCTEPMATCFCTSFGGAPTPREGFDVRLTELPSGRAHRFLVQPGSDAGRKIVERLALPNADERDLQQRSLQERRAKERVSKRLDTNGLREVLGRNLESPKWEAAAEQCLACGSCTMVCPTCFCSNTEDGPVFGRPEAVRRRVWDTCFNSDFTYIHGGNVRQTPMSRYRHWVTHKLATWIDQFGTIGCVGCGRCITWCPVGIDLTEVVQAIRRNDLAAKKPAARRERKDDT